MLSKKALSVNPSPTLAIDALAKKMKAEGVDVIGFGAGEPDFDTPAHIREAAVRALQDGFTRYTPAAGLPELQQAVCRKLQDDNGLTYSPEEIVISNGAKHSLTNVFAALLNPGDEVIIPAPFWVSYPEMVKLNDGVPVIIPTTRENRFKMTAAELAAALTARTRAIVLNSPSNPTGQVYTREELAAIASFATANSLYVVSDEIYEKLIYGIDRHISIASLGKEIRDLTVVVNGVSKTYAMTGWRIGYTASASGIAKVMASIQSHATSNPNTMAQKATIAALEGPQDCVEEMKQAFAQRRDYMVEIIGDTPGISCLEPAGAFYVFMDVSSTFGQNYRGRPINSCDDFASLLLEGEKVAVVPGTGFGSPDYVRLSYALAMTQVEKGMARIGSFVREIR
jgi:aspartate aminotransferase